MTIQALIFDLDNTLTHRDLSIQAFSQDLYRQFQLKINQAKASAITTILDSIRYIDNGGYPLRERMTVPTIGGSVAELLLKTLSWNNPPDLDELTAFWFSHFGSNAIAMPNAERVLDQLKAQGFKLAIISNGGHSTRLNILEGLNFLSYFDYVISSESVGITKPNPEIFLHCCRLLELSPQHCLYVGDHPINDYSGATKAGLHALLLEGFHELTPENAPPQQHIIQSLTQIFNFLELSRS